MTRKRGLAVARAALFATIAFRLSAAQAAVVVSAGATSNITCANRVCTPSSADAVLNATYLAGLLRHSDITVAAAAPADTIVIGAPLAWTSRYKLALAAAQDVIVEAPVTVEGRGAVAITTGRRYILLFEPGGSLNFWGLANKLVIDRVAFKLESNIQQLAADIATTPSGAFALAGNYDASKDGTYSQAVVQTDFGGIFDGLGHSIENLSISANVNDCIGLFSRVDGATLRNIQLTNAAVTDAMQGTVGALAACTGGGSVTIESAGVSGSVSGAPNGNVGGLAGGVQGVIVNANSSATVSFTADNTASTYVGGLVGYITGTVELSHATGNVTGGANSCAGGLAGFASGILESYATGNVSIGNYQMPLPQSNLYAGAGGLACAAEAEKSYATGNVTAGNSNMQGGVEGGVGGLLGYGQFVYNCYATGAVQGGALASVGGLVGDGDAVQYSYATGKVTGGSSSYVGGLIGQDNFPGSLFDTDWDTTTSSATVGAGNPTNDTGVAGRTTAQLQARLPRGFSAAIWGQSPVINGGLPYLHALPSP